MAIHTEPKAKIKLKGKTVKVATYQRSRTRLFRAIESQLSFVAPTGDAVQIAARMSSEKLPTFEQSHFQPTRQELDEMETASSRFLENLTDDRLGDFVEA